MKKGRSYIYILLFIALSLPFFGRSKPYTMAFDELWVMPRDSVLSIQIDSIRAKSDSIPVDSVAIKKSPLEAVVEYTANDSIVLTAGNLGYLYGDAEVKYTSIELKAEYITMNMDSSLVAATFGVDSLGTEFGHPVFTDAGTDYESKTMKYNFKSKKGYITNVITQQGEGYVVGNQAKKTPDESLFMKGGFYSTCDDHEHPHFGLALTKAKVHPKKNVVFGPAYLVIEGLPIKFIGLPFGYFPFTDKYSSGVIMPSPGDDMERGYNLRDGGYYFAINDNVDLALTGEIYTNGSWGLNGRSTYRKRYKYSGNFNGGYLVTVRGDKGLPDYSVAKDLRFSWSHAQDPKSNMYRTLSANVDFSTSSYNRNQLDAAYDASRYTQDNKSSSISLTQRFPNSPFSMSASMRIDQRSRDSSIAMTLPDMTITMSRISPFKRKEAVGDERWYEKIQMSYTGRLSNRIDTKEKLLLKSNLIKDWKHEMTHTVPISATFNLFNYLNITPSINYKERWYTQKVKQGYNQYTNSFVKTDTVQGFARVYDFSASIGMQTKLYGRYKPLFYKKADIRHVFTPSVSFSASPDFTDPWFGYYDRIHYYDANGGLKTHEYALYDGATYGGKSGTISFDFQNNLEMKLETGDTIKKISLLDNLGISFSNNLMADSLNWSDINANARFKLSKSLTVNLNASFDPYMYGEDGQKINKLRIKNGKGLARLRQTSYSISPSINQDTFKKWFGGKDKEKDKDKNKNKKSSTNDPDDPLGDSDQDTFADPNAEGEGKKSLLAGKKDNGSYDNEGYVDNSIKWSISTSYTFGFGYYKYNPMKGDMSRRLTTSNSLAFNGNIQPTQNWNFSFNASYDFEFAKVTYMNWNVSRNLHCWTLSASFMPIGMSPSYFVTLRANSSMLQDLKYEQRGRSTSYDPNW